MIGIASDHGGFVLKQYLLDKTLGFSKNALSDFGCYNLDSVDYPIYGHKISESITNGEMERGIIICGTGIGISISANRHPGVRAALCYDVTTARLAREHNNANVLELGARMTAPELALEILDVFLKTEFEGGRHKNRVDAIELPNKKSFSTRWRPYILGSRSK